MEIIQIIILVLLIYLVIILLISFIRALIAVRKGVSYAKKKFKETFWTFFSELLNPLNWLDFF
jgi:hypothetical protein